MDLEIYNNSNFSQQIEDQNEILLDRSKCCFVCDTESIVYFYSCGNGVCNSCLLGHLKEQISKYKIKLLSEKINFVCAGSCRCTVDSKEMESKMDDDTKNLYFDVLFKMYISKTQDVLSCPKSSCNGFGYYENTLISECYECHVCKHKWNIHNSKFLNYLNISYILELLSFSNIKTSLKKYITTKYCNKCSAPIEKIDGCKHMECNRCEFSFCWKCMDNWKTHSELACMGKYTNIYDEGFRPDYLPFVFTLLIVLTSLKFIFSFWFIIFILKFVLKLFSFAFFILIDCFLAHGVLFCLNKIGSKTKSFIILSVGISFEIFLGYFNLHPFSRRLYYYNLAVALLIYLLIICIKKKL